MRILTDVNRNATAVSLYQAGNGIYEVLGPLILSSAELTRRACAAIRQDPRHRRRPNAFLRSATGREEILRGAWLRVHA
jgi:hypothetical protein